jgi:hypothetical protein
MKDMFLPEGLGRAAMWPAAFHPRVLRQATLLIAL